MNIAVFILFILGMLIEIISLWHGPLPGADKRSSDAPGLINSIPENQRLSGMLIIAAALVYGFFTLTGLGTGRARIDSGVVGLVFALVGLFVFFAGVVGTSLLPRINEQTLFAITLIALLSLFTPEGFLRPSPTLIVGLIIPSLAVLVLVFSKRVMPPVVKALYYFWYLVMVMVIAFQSSQFYQMAEMDLELLDALFFGAFFVFLMLHGMFFLRFFLITASLILPRNHRHVRMMMPRLFSDEQMPLWQFVLISAVIAGAILANLWLDLASQQTLINLLTLLTVQVMFSPWLPKVSEAA